MVNKVNNGAKFMTPKQISLVQETWAKVKPIAPQAAEIFYTTLFEMDPTLKPLFKNNMTDQGNKLMTMLDTAVKLLNSPEKLIPAVEKLGARHVDYGVTSAHYDTVGAALLKTLETGLGDAFTLTVRKAWTAVYKVLSNTMIEAADAAIAERNQLAGNTMSNEENEITAFIQGALAQSGTAFMMIDRDFIITYVNESTMKLLRSHEATFQKKWPSFKADKNVIIGFCIDGFHANPAHQRKLLDDPNNLPYTTDIQIEHLTIELNVTAITNANGDYIGNSLEWSDVTQIRFDNDRATQLQGAIDQSNTPSMMIDRDFIITYANKATFALLKENEETFQQAFPGFKADENVIIGACIDGFHKNPAHQRKLLDDPNNLPWQTDIQVMDLIFELNVTAIMNGSGEYIGNSLEWGDVTKVRADNNQAVQLQGAIDQSNTPSMMIDRNFLITYANKATFTLLKENEETFKKAFPGFKADKDAVIGACIDVFHKNPAHQRKLLDDPNNLPWQTDIQVLHLTFELNVTAIMNASGEYIGNSLEWQNVTEIREKSIEVGRLSSAVEGMTTNLMMADTKGNIVYANPAVCKMLARREAQIQKVLPSFSVATMVGTNFDSFHRNPAHQQNLLGNPDNLPYDTEISLVGLTFQLIAIALRDEQGNHVGTAVQWLDLTEEKDAQGQVENMINDAISGQLDSRIDTSEYNGFMKGLGDNINGLMDAIVEPINEAINVAQALSDGDLSKTMDGVYAGEFLALAEAMNGSIENLNNMVEEIRSASTNVFDTAREIAEGNNELSHRTESQASSLEETASAMEELTSTVQQNAENATEASKLSVSVMDKASNGGGVVKSAITAMSDINKSSKKIADIISVIDEIAFQTNLLALNAAVEAARAGEQGRGFAVVAAEVRNLAQRSAGAAKEIKGLINDSVEAVGQGTKLVDETGQTFTELVSAIEEVGKMIGDIDSAGKEQSAGIGEVSAAVSQMDEMTQQNAALVEEAAASSKSMEEQSQALLDQVAFFNNEAEDEIKTPVRRGTSQQATGRSSRSKPSGRAPSRKPSPAPKGRREKTETDQEWEEF
jgi:methyl-accepting chemotaxis protein